MNRRSFQRLSEDERRRDLLEATLDCVAEFGLDGASARRIAERAGVTAGLIRHYFGSKDELLNGAYGYLIGQMTTAVAQFAEAGGPEPARQLAHFITANVSGANLSDWKVSLWASFIGRVRTDPAYAAIHRESYREFLELLAGLIHPLLRDAGRPADPTLCQHYAIALNGLLDGLWLEGALGHGLYNPASLPGIALASAEGILGLAPGSLARHAAIPPS